MSEEEVLASIIKREFYNKHCRVCLNIIQNNQSSETVTCEYMLQRCTLLDILNILSEPLQISSEDNLPKTICKCCVDLIMNTYDLQSKLKESDELLKKILSSLYNDAADFAEEPPEIKDNIVIVILDDEQDEDSLVDEQELLLTEYEEEEEENDREEKIDFVDLESDNLSPPENGIKYDIREVLKELKISETQCTMCLEDFETLQDLKDHESTHIIDSRHICKLCLRTYRKYSILKRHYVTHTKQKKFVCKVCGKDFYHQNSLTSHMVYHKDRKIFCEYCDKRFFFKHSLNNHLNICQNAPEQRDVKEGIVNECTMCEETFPSEEELKTHKKMHPPGSRHYCKTCNKSYLDPGSLRRHLIVHTGKKKYLCNTCGKSFFYKNVLRSHMIFHNEKKHSCTMCDKKFFTASILKEHIRLNHSTNKFKFMCEECGKLCSSQNTLVAHRASHVKICCPICGKSYRNRRYYRDHLKLHNRVADIPKKKFICDYCGEEKTVKTVLEKHILSKHLNDRRYKCGICGKGFFSNGGLSEHKIVHTRERREQCDICEQKFINKKSLALHYRRHTGEKPFPCNICGEKFISTTRRKVHEKCRHGEKTELCSVCPAKFFLKSELNKHMVSHIAGSKKVKKMERNIAQ